MNKRVALVTILSVGVLVGWMMLQTWLWPPQKPRPRPKPAAVDVEPAWANVPKLPVVQDPPTQPAVAVVDDIVIDTTHYRATFTNRDAGLVDLELKYRGKPVKLLRAREAKGPSHLALTFPDEAEQAAWEVRRDGLRVTFTRRLRNGLELEKTFELDPEKPRLRMRLEATNRTGAPLPLRMEMDAFHGMPHDSDYRAEIYASGFVATTKRDSGGFTLQFTSTPDAQKKPVPLKGSDLGKDHEYDAVGIKNRYFAVALVPAGVPKRAIDTVTFSIVDPLPKPGGMRAHVRYREIEVQQREILDYAIFAGPLVDESLKPAGHGLDGLHDYASGCGCGPFAATLGPVIRLVGPVLLAVMTFWHALFGNWGVAIILTTLVLRLCMFPLTRKSAVSMSKMSLLQPQVTIIRERHADNPQKAQQEMMKLWKENGVSPLSGCLPMFLQLPIWIAMYSVVDMSIELRQAPFMLWMKDLSLPDRLIPFGREYSLLLTTADAINVLPIVMTMVSFLQMYFAPRSPDPQMQQQQKMMMFMPFMIGLVCYSLGSGLSLYFLFNSLLSLTEQWIIKRVWIKPAQPQAKA